MGADSFHLFTCVWPVSLVASPKAGAFACTLLSLCGLPQSLLAATGTQLKVAKHLQQFLWKLLVLRTGNFKAQLSSEAEKVFRALSLSPGFPASVSFIWRPLPCVQKVAAAASVYILTACDYKQEKPSLCRCSFSRFHGRSLLGSGLATCLYLAPEMGRGSGYHFWPGHI